MDAVIGRHMRVGWWALLAFTVAGLGLEYLHAIKLSSYLTEAAESRRLMWTLGHAHGTALAILNIVFAVTLRSGVLRIDGGLRGISNCLIAATVLLPVGFFLGGIRFYGGDPGLGAVAVPIGAVLLIVAIGLIAVRVDR